jgi:hypothetical protein
MIITKEVTVTQEVQISITGDDLRAALHSAFSEDNTENRHLISGSLTAFLRFIESIPDNKAKELREAVADPKKLEEFRLMLINQINRVLDGEHDADPTAQRKAQS